MRVISGSAKGRKLKTPGKLPVRPTSDKIKGAIFNILRDQVQDARVLDLFAGTGSLGIEALSRGASHVTFVEKNPKTVELVKSNLELTGFTNQADVINGDGVWVLSRLGGQGRVFDLIFIDPPFESDLVRKSLDILDLGTCIGGESLIITRQPPHIDTEEEYRGDFKQLTMLDYREYGDSTVIIFSFTPAR
jgi:16S rRNA (guanine(966)-N(2))-methyltransferase RsmD